MLPFRPVRSWAPARLTRSLFVRQAPLAPSTLLRQQRIPHPSTPTKSVRPSPLPRRLPRTCPAQSPFRRPGGSIPSRSVDKRLRISVLAAHSQMLLPKSFRRKPPSLELPDARLRRSSSHKPPPRLSRPSIPPVRQSTTPAPPPLRR